MILGQHHNALTPQVPEVPIGSENQPTPGSGEVSNNKFDHINNNHNYNKLIEQIERRLTKGHTIEQIIRDLKFDRTVFNPSLSEDQIRTIVSLAYNETIRNGMLDGIYTTTIYGEIITIFLEEGILKSAWDIFNKGGK